MYIIYIYMSYICILYIYIYIYMYTSLCLYVYTFLRARNSGWTQQGLNPARGVQVRDEKSFATRGPRKQFGMKIMRAASSLPAIALLKSNSS